MSNLFPQISLRPSWLPYLLSPQRLRLMYHPDPWKAFVSSTPTIAFQKVHSKMKICILKYAFQNAIGGAKCNSSLETTLKPY